MSNYFQIKQCSLKVKDVDYKGRTVIIYPSAFNDEDSDGDVILPGAFKKTISENGPDSRQPRIKHLRQHITSELVGKPKVMLEDSKGLLVHSIIANTTLGNDVLKLYELDLYEHSIGFQIPQGKTRKEGSINYISEIKLFEYSSVTWGAQADTPLVGMKSLSKDDQLASLGGRIEKMAKAFSRGTFTDELFTLLEIEMKQMQQCYSDLVDPPSRLRFPMGAQETENAEAMYLINVFRKALGLGPA
jgi:HK97 family phage prohead protease